MTKITGISLITYFNLQIEHLHILVCARLLMEFRSLNYRAFTFSQRSFLPKTDSQWKHSIHSSSSCPSQG